MKVRIIGTRKQPGRCAYCHDRLEALGHACEGCQTWLHLDCWQEIGTCPSPGCSQPAPSKPSPRREPRIARGTRSVRDRGRGRAHARNDETLQAWADESAWRRDYTWWARTAPYCRLILSLSVNLAVVLAVLCVALYGLTHWSTAWHALKQTKHGTSSPPQGLFLLTLFVGGGGAMCFFCGRWLEKWPRVWTETHRLLGYATPEPLRMRVWTEKSGKHKNTYAEFKDLQGNRRSGMERVSIEGLLPPLWLRRDCASKPVLVYGLEDGEPPYLIEDISGQLALIHP